MDKTENTLIYLIGYPAVGKLTIAKTLCTMFDAVIIDNHMANNPIFTIIGADGNTPIPNAAWDRVKAVRDIYFDTMLNVAPKESNFILTNVLLDDAGDRALFEQVRDLAEKRGSLFIPVIITCQEQQHNERITALERKRQLKDTNVESVKRIMQANALLPISYPNLLQLDNTHLSAQEAAEAINHHISKCNSE